MQSGLFALEPGRWAYGGGGVSCTCRHNITQECRAHFAGVSTCPVRKTGVPDHYAYRVVGNVCLGQGDGNSEGRWGRDQVKTVVNGSGQLKSWPLFLWSFSNAPS